jgi:K+-transporting ATPase c subunit
MEGKLGKPLEQRLAEVIEEVLQEARQVPLGGLAGVDLFNVLQVNLAMDARMKRLAPGWP